MNAGKAELDRLVESVAAGKCIPFVAKLRLKAIERKYGEAVFDFYRIANDDSADARQTLKILLSTYRLGGSSKELVSHMIEVSKRAFIVRWITGICLSVVMVVGMVGLIFYIFRR